MNSIKQNRIALLLFVVACFALNCTPKAKPASSGTSNSSSSNSSSSSSSSSKSTGSSKATCFDDLSAEAKIAAISNLSDGEYHNGMTIYQAKCGTCHELHEPGSRDIGGWLRVMHPMSKKAKLTDQEHKEVAGYLYNNCKK